MNAIVRQMSVLMPFFLLLSLSFLLSYIYCQSSVRFPIKDLLPTEIFSFNNFMIYIINKNMMLIYFFFNKLILIFLVKQLIYIYIHITFIAKCNCTYKHFGQFKDDGINFFIGFSYMYVHR